MSKIIETGSNSRVKLLSGVEQLAKAVVATLGPNGVVVPNKLEVGVTVMVPKFGAQTVVVGNESYVVASEHDVLGIIKGKDETYPEFVEKHYKKEDNE